MTISLISTAPSELGVDASSAVRDIARRIAGGRTSTTILADDLSSSWAALAAGGWDCVGIRDGDDGASLLDLVAIAQAWGEQCLPLPLIPMVLAKRWSVAAASHEGPVTFAIPHAGGSGALVPFAAVPAVLLCTELSWGSTSPLIAVAAVGADDLAGTLALGRAGEASKLSAEAAHECAVVWGAEMVGAARRLLDEGVAYAKVREQFGTPIGSFQAVKHQLADAHILLEQAETAVLWAATSSEIATGERFALSLPSDLVDPPLFGRQPLHREVFATSRNEWDEKYDSMYPQAASQWDGLLHVRAREYGFWTGCTGGSCRCSGSRSGSCSTWMRWRRRPALMAGGRSSWPGCRIGCPGRWRRRRMRSRCAERATGPEGPIGRRRSRS